MRASGMGRGRVLALVFGLVAMGCGSTLPVRAQSGGGQTTPPAPQGGNPFPGDTTNVPVMPSKDNPNPPSVPAPPAGQNPERDSAPGAGTQTQGSNPGAAGGSNQFPEDTSNVPVMPSKGTVALPEGTYTGDNIAANFGLPNDDADPVKSPDDPVTEASSDNQSYSSSNVPGMDKILDRASDKGDSEEQQAAKKKRRGGESEDQPADHKETSSEDIEVGKFEIDRKNWKAALSRFESAMVLSPDDPEVYWGLAESERGLGQYAEARANYKKLLDYDPDGPHGKAARKALADPQIANAVAAAPGLSVAK